MLTIVIIRMIPIDPTSLRSNETAFSMEIIHASRRRHHWIFVADVFNWRRLSFDVGLLLRPVCGRAWGIGVWTGLDITRSSTPGRRVSIWSRPVFPAGRRGLGSLRLSHDPVLAQRCQQHSTAQLSCKNLRPTALGIFLGNDRPTHTTPYSYHWLLIQQRCQPLRVIEMCRQGKISIYTMVKDVLITNPKRDVELREGLGLSIPSQQSRQPTANQSVTLPQ